jgi:hypothetical protein
MWEGSSRLVLMRLHGGGDGMVAFFLGIIVGVLGGFLFLFLLSELIRKDDMMELSEPLD